MWIVKHEFLDKRLGRHTVELHHPETGAVHLVHILIGHDACPTCGHVQAKGNTRELDPQQIVAAELNELNKAHSNLEHYRQKHRVPVKK